MESIGPVPRFREAVLLPLSPEMAREARGFETMCLNRGFEVRIFDDRSAALAWLGED